MKLNLGSKNGKSNRRLFFLNWKRKKNLENVDSFNKQKKNDDNKKLKELEDVRISFNKNHKPRLVGDNKEKEYLEDVIIEKLDKKKDLTNTKKNDNINNIDNDSYDVGLSKDFQNIDKSNSKDNNELVSDTNYLEKQIIKILEQQIDDSNYGLKKIDSELYAIQKEIDDLEEKEDVQEILKEIEFLIGKLKTIKKQIVSLQQTFDFDSFIDDPDNYLIYLVDEIKEKRKNCQLLSDKLKENDKYKNIVDEIIEIELRQEKLLNKLKEKEEQLDLDNEQISKLNESVIDLEEMKTKINNMLKMQNNLLEEVKIKVNETVHVTEKVDYISKSVKHSLFELFLLMAMLKHNLSIKNNVVAAISAKATLDLIIKMTTPVTEKVVTMVSDVSDYSDIINSCLNDTTKLENIMDENLNNVSSLLYMFEHDYKECSYLDSYQDALNRIISLDRELRERKIEITKIKEETQLQLEKNEAKIKKYGSIVA